MVDIFTIFRLKLEILNKNVFLKLKQLTNCFFVLFCFLFLLLFVLFVSFLLFLFFFLFFVFVFFLVGGVLFFGFCSENNVLLEQNCLIRSKTAIV